MFKHILCTLFGHKLVSEKFVGRRRCKRCGTYKWSRI